MPEAKIKIPNHLIKEKSPYLLQHAYNPVNWYPWSDEAFEKALKENKPIFLSIGYSTCHWCHVMEHESFEDEDVAKLLNEDYISIKVDREERPDIDNIYMMVCQMMTGSGGWPLTVIMKPDKKPFFAGTYFPKESRHGRIGMTDLLPKIIDAWKTRHNEIIESSEHITNALIKFSNSNPDEKLDSSILTSAYNQLNHLFDGTNAGFGRAPKFPTPHKYLFLLRHYHRTDDKNALEMVEKTLEMMREGGIYDHVGFGFHRYSTDENWFLPHFEKMLYDQALLSIAYTEAYLVTKKELYKNTTNEILTYILRDMTHEQGGFYSAEDADSEGEEGKFYTWTEGELKDILKEDASLFIKYFNVKPEGNYIEEATRYNTGTNILHSSKTLSWFINDLKIDEKEIPAKIEECREKLFQIREKRVHPYKDDKILTDWNGLMIAAFSKAGQALNRKDYIDAAKKAVDFIFTNLYKEDKLLHRFRDGEAKINAHLDDYAFLVWGLLELYESTFEMVYLERAIKLSNQMIENFYDEKNGGFYLTSRNETELIARMKDIYDGAIPSGNSISMLNLIKLSKITGDKKYEDIIIKTLSTFSKMIKESPISHSMMMASLEFLFSKSYEIVIVGDLKSNDTKKILDYFKDIYLPNKVLLLKSDEEGLKGITEIAKYIKPHEQIDNKATVYICQNYNCKLPITDLNKISEAICNS